MLLQLRELGLQITLNFPRHKLLMFESLSIFFETAAQICQLQLKRMTSRRRLLRRYLRVFHSCFQLTDASAQICGLRLGAMELRFAAVELVPILRQLDFEDFDSLKEVPFRCAGRRLARREGLLARGKRDAKRHQLGLMPRL